jgi:hypothetical protein
MLITVSDYDLPTLQIGNATRYIEAPIPTKIAATVSRKHNAIYFPHTHPVSNGVIGIGAGLSDAEFAIGKQVIGAVHIVFGRLNGHDRHRQQRAQTQFSHRPPLQTGHLPLRDDPLSKIAWPSLAPSRSGATAL